MLNEAGRLCYYAVRETQHLIIIDEALLSKADLLTLGLFIEGSEKNSVTLPHPLFQEYLAALYLSTDKYARDALFKEIKRKSEHTDTPGPRLVDAVRLLGLENVIRFLVGLLPATTQQLFRLFVIRQSEMYGAGWGVQYKNDIQYELDLLQECTDDKMKSALANALLDAPVVRDSEQRSGVTVANRGSYHLLNCFTDKQRQMFLQKVYNCQLCVQDDRPTLRQVRDGRDVYWDSYVVGFVYLFNCSIKMKKLYIGQSQLPIDMLSHNMTNVDELDLLDSTLVEELPELSSLPSRQPPTRLTSSVCRMFLYKVQGVNRLYSHTLPGTHRLELFQCAGVIDMNRLSLVFPEVSEIQVRSNKCCYCLLVT